jgi:hypothetical protein
MSWRAVLRLAGAALTLLAAWIATLPAGAQVRAAVGISQPNTQDFPTVQLLVSVKDNSGRRVAGLTASSFSAIEDDFLVSDVQVEEVLVGTRQVFVINTGPGMRVRDSHGRTRFDFVRTALTQLWRLPQASLVGVDDLSLLTGDGLLVQHSQAAAELASSLGFSEPTFAETDVGLDLLLSGLDFSADPGEGPLKPANLIFLTSLFQPTDELALANAIARAREGGTSVYPVLLAAPESLEDPMVEGLRQLAEATGGEFVFFNPEIGLTSLAERVLESRVQYLLTYQSRASQSGPHAVQVRVTGEGLDAVSELRPFEVEVQPPEIAFIQPPLEIVRQADDPAVEPRALPPTSQTLSLLITFPDRHPRELLSSTLWVDDEIAAVNEQPPFDQFEWDLRSYVADERHILRAVVQDSLGLESASVDIPVEIRVAGGTAGLAALRPAVGPLVAVAAVLVAGSVLAVGLVALGRRARPERTELAHPPRLNPLKRTRIQKQPIGPAEAHLIPVVPRGPAVPLLGLDIVLGRDPSLAAVVLDDPSVDGMHARLIRQAGGSYLLRDQGSIAGTWVNYHLVPEGGRVLEHGDLLQLGRVEFRFQVAGEAPQRELRVYPASDPLRPSGLDDQEQA